ncbi:uncharacterized protein F5147DRAFT_702224 [Suillus discolor]|uniref:Mid2 domain-containing protein n=1 Tax=Suillus discolor TaxID=1912936 RepID=A0A9P7F586_9AGAM|nr:uncharacterized protein F5147DRAFT_702224 [Suillus discolor]KAG2105856.1 hypothetical protein F5147DRAFT_702224 [Suillus discolor]
MLALPERVVGLVDMVFQPPLGFLVKGRRMTPPHTRFKLLSHNRLSHRSRHTFNRAEPQHSFIETVTPVQEDGLHSLDQTRDTSVDGLNGGLKPSEEPEIEPVDCTLSGCEHLSDEQATSTIPSFEAGDLPVGSPRHVKEGYIIRRGVTSSTSVSKEAAMTLNQAVTVLPLSTLASSILTSPTLTSPTLTPLALTSSTLTSSHSTASSANSVYQCDGVLCSLSTITLQTSGQQSPSTPSSNTIYPASSIPNDATVSPNPDTSATTTAITTISLQPVLASGTASLSSTVVASSASAQSTSVSDTNSDPQSPPHTAAIVGGAIGAVALLALLIFIAICYRRRRQPSVTPFILPSTAAAAQTVSPVSLRAQSIGDAVRPDNRSLSSVYSDPYRMEYPGNKHSSFLIDSVSNHLPDSDNEFPSVIVLHQQSNGLERLDLSPSRACTSDHYCHSSVENWVQQVVMEDCSRESSEVLPAYWSTKSLKNGKTKSWKNEKIGHDDYDVPSSPSPLLP